MSHNAMTQLTCQSSDRVVERRIHGLNWTWQFLFIWRFIDLNGKGHIGVQYYDSKLWKYKSGNIYRSCAGFELCSYEIIAMSCNSVLSWLNLLLDSCPPQILWKFYKNLKWNCRLITCIKKFVG